MIKIHVHTCMSSSTAVISSDRDPSIHNTCVAVPGRKKKLYSVSYFYRVTVFEVFIKGGAPTSLVPRPHPLGSGYEARLQRDAVTDANMNHILRSDMIKYGIMSVSLPGTAMCRCSTCSAGVIAGGIGVETE